MVTQKGVPQFTSDFGEPPWQSFPAGWGIGCFWSHTAIALYPIPASGGHFRKQEDAADPEESAYRHRFLVF